MANYPTGTNYEGVNPAAISQFSNNNVSVSKIFTKYYLPSHFSRTIQPFLSVVLSVRSNFYGKCLPLKFRLYFLDDVDETKGIIKTSRNI